MKHKLIAMTLACSLLLGGCASSSPAPRLAVTEPETTVAEMATAPAEVDYEAVYQPVLDRVVLLLQNPDDSDGPEEGETGIREAAHALDALSASEGLGYRILDISGDGIPELLIGDRGTEPQTSLYAVYTCKDDAPRLCLEGWARNRYYLLEDGNILNEGSSGAMYSIWGTYAISQDGTQLTCLDYFFTHERGDNFEDITVYHNLTGEWDVDKSEEIPMELEQFWRMQADAEAQICEIPLLPFSEYGQKVLGSFLRAELVNADTELPQEYSTFTADESEFQSRILFRPFGEVIDVKLLKLTYSPDNMDYAAEAIYSAESLPLIVTLTFWGDLPSYGIQFTNDQSVTRSYALQLSGENGRLILFAI